MSKFEVRKPHSKDKAELREVAEGLASQLSKAHGVRAAWNGDRVQIRGSGVKGELTIDESEVIVRVELGLLAMPFKSALEGEVRRYLDEFIG
ncbi:MAG: polyhydroxyalkanoic acid system family protein [Pseudomonadota bacterium]